MSFGKKFRKLASVVCSFLMGSSGFTSAVSLSPYVSKADYDGVIELAKSVGLKNDSFDDIKKQIKNLENSGFKELRLNLLNGVYFCINFIQNNSVKFDICLGGDKKLDASCSLDDFYLLARYFNFSLECFKFEGSEVNTSNYLQVELLEKKKQAVGKLLWFFGRLFGMEDTKNNRKIFFSKKLSFKDDLSMTFNEWCIFTLREKGEEVPHLYNREIKLVSAARGHYLLNFQKYLAYLVSLIKLRNSGLSEEVIDKKIKEISKPVDDPSKVPVENPVKEGVGKTGTACLGVGGVIVAGGIAYGLYEFSNKASGKRKSFKKRIKKQKKLSGRVNRVN